MLTQNSLGCEVLQQPCDAGAPAGWFAVMVKLFSEHKHFIPGGEQSQFERGFTPFHELHTVTNFL